MHKWRFDLMEFGFTAFRRWSSGESFGILLAIPIELANPECKKMRRLFQWIFRSSGNRPIPLSPLVSNCILSFAAHGLSNLRRSLDVADWICFSFHDARI